MITLGNEPARTGELPFVPVKSTTRHQPVEESPMDMKTFKFLEFAAIFGALGYFWWTQRQSRLRYEEEKRQKAEAEASAASGGSQDKQP
jgi:hypothetical protein